VDFVFEHEEEATQVLDRGDQAGARGSCLSQILDRGAHEEDEGASREAAAAPMLPTVGGWARFLNLSWARCGACAVAVSQPLRRATRQCAAPKRRPSRLMRRPQWRC
jgi:hypothetical protein